MSRLASTRRHRRLTVLAVGATVLAAALALLTVYAFAQRGEAGKQRRAEQVQADNALGQKKLAQKGVLGDRKLKDLAKKVVITSFELNPTRKAPGMRGPLNWQPKVFQNFEGRDLQELAVDAALRLLA